MLTPLVLLILQYVIHLDSHSLLITLSNLTYIRCGELNHMMDKNDF